MKFPAASARLDAGEGQEGRPDVRPAHARRRSRPTARWPAVMPHGVLFRGGEEKEARKHFIKDGILEAVIGLPAGPVLRHRHPGLRPGHEQEGRRQPQARPLHQRRPGIQGRQEPELPPPRGHREDHPRLPHACRTCPATPASCR